MGEVSHATINWHETDCVRSIKRHLVNANASFFFSHLLRTSEKHESLRLLYLDEPQQFNSHTSGVPPFGRKNIQRSAPK